ncbi:MAG: hypothetical protein Q7T30_00585 [Planctomycetota bacterium]|nr:hypothetical protein [Planctomycetota bacterium]
MSGNLRVSVVLSLLLLLTGCLEFDAQEITFRYDQKLDRIDALVVYRGLFVESGSGSSDKPNEKALADLDEAMKHGEFFFWCNWPFHVDPTVDAGPGKALLPHMEVETGGLFTDPKGILCGYQFVRIQQAASFLKKVNTMLEVGVQAALVGAFNGRGEIHKFDDDTREAVREFLRSGEKMLAIEAGRIELRMPCSANDERYLKQQLEALLLENMPREMVRRAGVEEARAKGGDVTETSIQNAAVSLPGESLRDSIRMAGSFRFFWDNDFTLDHRDDVTTIALGRRGGEELKVSKASDGFYHPAFLEKLRERGDKIEDGLPDQELARRFVAFRGRDAVLPETLAAQRKSAVPQVKDK